MARELFPPSPSAPPVPVPLAVDGWRDLLAEPEMACAEAWIAACSPWWSHPTDDRLRAYALGELVLGERELARWLDVRLDRAGVVDAHAHVVSMRAGLERDPSKRTLDTDGLRSGGVSARHRGGGRTVFVPADDVPRLVERLCEQLAVMPSHPFVRAAWLVQAVGAVHPFRDANGGASRFLASLELARCRLPPLSLSPAVRNGCYIEALMRSNRSLRIDGLAHVVADVVQRGLAGVLLAGIAPRAAWSPRLVGRAERWRGVVADVWESAVGEPLGAGVACAEASPGARERLIRRGYRIPAVPAPQLTTWSLSGPLPIQLDAMIAPVRAGDACWLVASVAGSVGLDGTLGAVQLDESVGAVMVAPEDEPDAMADARFSRWVGRRLAQYVQGLAHWT
jgi:hypothetical protein